MTAADPAVVAASAVATAAAADPAGWRGWVR